ncbi:hypothetical protein PIB30_005028 [Stylosanthes scabra]|uniref:Uncharacterized protein n=1 Tax=Stylosanthes scabra TaxID=79078 RepID=A0ABU6Y5M5_9FABA|nr:hypothetical protein [Stylosanthes scabra]
MPPEQLLGESYHLHAKSLACFQVGVEASLAAKVKAEKELSAALDQIEILKGEKDSALSYLPFKEKTDTFKDELSEKSLEHQSALDRIAQLEEDNRVLKTQFKSSQLSLEARTAAGEGQVGSLAASLKSCQADLSKATDGFGAGPGDPKQDPNPARKSHRITNNEPNPTLGVEVTEMCQEMLDICLDQVLHLCPGVDFSTITLKSRWDPMGRRIFVPRELDEGEPSRITEVVPEQPPDPTVQATQSAAGDAAEVGGGCPT